MQRLQRQPWRDELGGQPVEQFRVRRPVALQAEIVRRADDAAAEVILPDAIDHHAGRERVVLATGEPVRPGPAVRPLLSVLHSRIGTAGSLAAAPRQDRRKAGLDLVAADARGIARGPARTVFRCRAGPCSVTHRRPVVRSTRRTLRLSAGTFGRLPAVGSVTGRTSSVGPPLR